MWGRANMAAVVLLLAWACVLACGEGNNPEVTTGDVEAEAILERATTWLWHQRDRDSGWGNDTHRVLLALRLANLSREENLPPPTSLEVQLSAKQMELEIVLLLWRHREVGLSAVNLARYTLALNALCMDPRQFHGHDLIGTLQHQFHGHDFGSTLQQQDPPTDYDFALTTLAACSAEAHVRKRQIRRLLDIADAAQFHNIDTVAMVLLALRCIVQDHRHRNLHHFVRKPSMGLAQRQRLDGSFGDLHTTALAMQALEEVENEPVDNWNKSAALAWLTSRQRADGSFDEDVRETAEVVMAAAPRSLASIRTLECGRAGDIIIPRLVPADDVTSPESRGENLIPSSPSLDPDNMSSTEATVAATTIPQLVNVSYTVWVGTNETYHLVVTAPKNVTFYRVMLLAAKMSPHFNFSAFDWPNGHYVHTLAGYQEELLSYHYWLLYRLPSMPDLKSPPGNQLVAPGGVDELHVSDGEHYLFWYKKL